METTPHISIYPNPFTDEISINAKNYSQAEIIHTETGVIKQQLLSHGKTTINTKSLPSGIYFILVRDKTGAIYYSKKIVKT